MLARKMLVDTKLFNAIQLCNYICSVRTHYHYKNKFVTMDSIYRGQTLDVLLIKIIWVQWPLPGFVNQSSKASLLKKLFYKCDYFQVCLLGL